MRGGDTVSGKCPHCGEELKKLCEVQETTVQYYVQLDGDAQGESGESLDYTKDDGFDCDCQDWGTAWCPECGGQIASINSEKQAVAFLKGELEVKL
jgi:hypothetical protein